MPTVLIVDDQPLVRTALRRYFEESNLADLQRGRHRGTRLGVLQV
jgi:DNA-binding NarL/FixJ family response regulator